MLSISRLKELALYDFIHSLTHLKGLAFIIPYFFFWFLVFDNVTQQAATWLQSTEGLFIVSWLLDDQALATQMFVDRSATLSIYFLISIFTTPLFVLLAANNQYASDAARGAFRFILTRATRFELYLARFLSVSLLVICCYLISATWATVQAYFNKEDTLEVIALFGFQTYVLVLFHSLPFIAFMSIISAMMRSAFASFFLALVIYPVLLVLIFWLADDFYYITYLVHGWIKPWLLDVSFENNIFSIGFLSLYTLLYFFVGWYFFNRRDL